MQRQHDSVKKKDRTLNLSTRLCDLTIHESNALCFYTHIKDKWTDSLLSLKIESHYSESVTQASTLIKQKILGGLIACKHHSGAEIPRF